MRLIRCSGCRKDERCCKSSKCDGYRRTRGLMMRRRDNKTWHLVSPEKRERKCLVHILSINHDILYYTVLYLYSIALRLHSLQASRPSVRGGGVTWRTAWSEHIIISNDRKHQTPFSVSKDPDMAILMLFSSSVSYLYLDYGDFLPSLNNKHSIHKVYWSLNPNSSYLDEFGFSGFVQNSIRATFCYLLPFPLYLERNPLNV